MKINFEVPGLLCNGNQGIPIEIKSAGNAMFLKKSRCTLAASMKRFLTKKFI